MEFNDFYPNQTELSTDIIKHHLKTHDLPVSDMLMSFARSIYAECKMDINRQSSIDLSPTTALVDQIATLVERVGKLEAHATTRARDIRDAITHALDNHDFSDDIARKMNDYDFSEDIGCEVANHDFSEAINHALDDHDFESEINDAVDDAISNYDFSEAISSALDNHDLNSVLEETLRGKTITIR